MKKPPAELPIRVIRERGSQSRRTKRVEGTENRSTSGYRGYVAKDVNAHRATLVEVGQQRQHIRRKEFRSFVTDQSLRRQRGAISQQALAGYSGEVFKRSGTKNASVSAFAIIIRIFTAIILLSVLLLVVSHGSETGNAIQKSGAFLANLTSDKPLFKKAS